MTEALTPAQERYCRILARRFFIPGYDVDDLEQECRLAMLQTPGDPNVGDVDRFAYTIAWRHLCDLLRTVKGRRGTRRATAIHFPLAPYVRDAERDSEALLYEPGEPDPELERVEERDEARSIAGAVLRALPALTPLEREALRCVALGQEIPRDLPDGRRPPVSNAWQRTRLKLLAA